jgi:hypothetical protein
MDIIQGKYADMSALGHKRTSPHVRVMSALPPKADITLHARYVPNCDID